MDNLLSSKDLESYHKNGFILVKKLFNKDEYSNFRARVDKLKTTVPKEDTVVKPGSFYFLGDLFSKGFGSLALDSRILSIAKQILGPQLVYFGESTVLAGVSAGRGFHRDNAEPDRQDPHAPDWKELNFPIIKMGIYLKDFKRFSGGLKIRKSSHLASDFIDPNNPNINNQEQGRGKIYNIPSESGDLTLWSIRLAHSVSPVRLKLFPNICFSPKIEGKIPGFLQAQSPEERIFLMITFGAPSSELDRYIKYYVERGDFAEHWKRSPFNDELVKSLATNGIEMRKTIPEYGSLCT